MKKVVILYPADNLLNESILFPKIFPNLDEINDCEIQVIGRISEKQFKEHYSIKSKYVDFFDGFCEVGKIGEREIAETEKTLGVNLEFLKYSIKRRWGWSHHSSKLDKRLVEYTNHFRKILKGADLVVSFLENLFFINVGEQVAKSMGIKVVRIGRSEIIKNGMIFWDETNDPIFYKKKMNLEAYEMLRKRVTSQRETIKIDKGAMNNLGKIVEKIPQIPKKLGVIGADKNTKFDIDVPPIYQKYKRLGSVSLRYMVYPPIHRLFFDKSREKEEFFLLPLHYEWEAQIALREPFLNQLDLAKKIALALPHGTKLYVKVHPHWKNADQGLGAVMGLKKIDGIRLIRPNENTMDLIEKSMGVIVINSTVGYEALALGKPLIVLGHEIYRKAGFEVRDLNELPYLLAKIRNKEAKIDQKEVEEFLKKYTSHVIYKEGKEQFISEFKAFVDFCTSK